MPYVQLLLHPYTPTEFVTYPNPEGMLGEDFCHYMHVDLGVLSGIEGKGASPPAEVTSAGSTSGFVYTIILQLI